MSINAGGVREIAWRGRTVTTAIFKRPVAGRAVVSGETLEGDAQADARVHGGRDKALYAYAAESYEWWSDRLGDDLAPGTFGDNLTLRGVAVDDALVGERWRVGSAVLEVTQPRMPCYKLGIRMGDERFPQRFSQAERPGAYLRVVEEGEVGAGDDVEVIGCPDHRVSVGLVAHIYYADQRRAEELLAAPLPQSWRGWARKRAKEAHGEHER